jgi:hypothetical protein
MAPIPFQAFLLSIRDPVTAGDQVGEEPRHYYVQVQQMRHLKHMPVLITYLLHLRLLSPPCSHPHLRHPHPHSPPCSHPHRYPHPLHSHYHLQ